MFTKRNEQEFAEIEAAANQPSRRAETTSSRSTRRRPPLLVFVHIPKTAGSTLRSVLNMNEPGSRSRALGNVFKGGGGIDRAVMTRMRRGEGPDLAGVQIVRGHFPLGIREYLHDYLPKQRELECFTFLRDPIDRTLSHYYAIRDRREGEEEPGRYSEAPLPPDPTLEDALEAGYVQDNLHTRMLCGDPEPFGEVTEDMLERAKQNLSTDLVFFGLTERFDESLVLAKRQLGLRVILYRSRGRVNPARPRGDQIPAELRRSAERCNRYDIELYRHASELFSASLEGRDLEFDVELAALRAARNHGDLDVHTPVPTGFAGDEEAWRMLVRTTATAQSLEAQLAGATSRAASDRARARVLKREVQRRDAPPARMAELEQEVERLRAATSRIGQLEAELKRLRAAGAASDQRPGREVPKGRRDRAKQKNRKRAKRAHD
jgi:hypothetical protein